MPKNYPATISLQFLAPDDNAPSRGIDLTSASIEFPPGAQLPRVGEFLQYNHWEGAAKLRKDQYVVLAVNTAISVFENMPEQIGWHTIITVGPIDHIADKRLAIVAD